MFGLLLIASLVPFCSATSDPQGIPVKYSSPICASTGGSTTLTCDGSYAVYDIFIGRDSFIGACGWTESSQLECSVDYTYSEEILEMMNIVYNRATECYPPTCEITGIPSISTSCSSDAVIRVAYFCYTDSLIRNNGGSLTQTSGCSVIAEDEGILFECPDTSLQVNLLRMDFSYLTLATASTTPKEACDDGNENCRLNYETDAQWVNVHKECLKHQNCPVAALGDDTGLVYGCSNLQVDDVDVVSYSYKFICQNPANFTIPRYILPEGDTCIGMSNGLHAVISGGRFDKNICFRSYTDCQNQEIQDILTCPIGQGFHESTRLCQNLASQYCSIGTPDLTTESVSATQITARWTIDDVPDSYNLTIQSANSGSFKRNLDSLTDTEYKFDQLNPNTNYSFFIVALKQNFESEVSTGWNVTYPENPTGTATNIASDQATIIWEYEFSASFVSISIDPSVQGGSTTVPASSNQVSTVIRNLEGGAEYKVTITLEGMTGLFSQEPYVITFRSIPLPPENLTASEVTESSIKFTWDQKGESDRWWYSLTPAPAVTGAITNGISERSFPSLEGGTSYKFTVSNHVGGLDSESIYETESTIPRPAFFENVSPQYNSAIVKWDHNDGRADQFSVEVQNRSNSQPVDEITTPEKNEEFLNLACGTIYRVILQAISYGKDSRQVERDFTTYPVAPDVLNVTSFNTNTAVLEWSSVDNCNVITYQLKYLDESALKEVNVSAPLTTATISDLRPGRTYRFEIKAGVSDHEGNMLLSTSNPQETSYTQTLIPLSPENLNVDDYSTDKLQVSWNAPTDSDFMDFEVKVRDKTILVVGGKFSATFPSLTPGSLQEITVTAFSRGPDSTQESEAVSKTQRLKPNPPTDFKEVSKTTNTTVISFKEPSGDYSEFSFEARSSSGAVVSSKNITESSENMYQEMINDSNIQYGDQIHVSIFTFSDTEKSEVPETGTVNLYPADPVDFQVTNFSTTTLDVAWTQPLGLYAKHELVLQRLDVMPSRASVTERRNASEMSNRFESLEPGGYYQVTIQTVSKFDSSLLSENNTTVEQILKPNPPIELNFEAIDKTSLNLTWIVDGKFHTFEVSFGSSSNLTRQFFEEIRSISPATNYTFSITTRMSDGLDAPIKSEVSTIVGYTFPDDVTGLNCVASSSREGVITVFVGWRLELVSYESFNFTFTTIPYLDEEVQQKTVILTQDKKGTVSPFTHVFNASDIEWLVPGLKIECAAVATYLQLESQITASQEFYAPPIAPRLSYVRGSRTATSLTFNWTFDIENAIVESFELQYSEQPIPDQNAIESKESESTNETISGLQPGQLYTFRIRSFVDNRTQSSNWSESVVQATYPEVPLNPVISYSYVSWSAPQDGFAEAYQIHVSDSFQNSDVINTTDSSQTNVSFIDFVNLNFVAGRRYTFNIFSLSNNLSSLTSVDVDFVLPPNDTSFVHVQETSTSSVSLTWQVPDGDVEKYILTIIPLNANDLLEQFSIEVPDRRSHIKEITDLTPGAEYEFRIVASTNSEFSENSGQINFQMQPLLSAVQISSFSETSASCSWNFIGIVDNFTVSLRDHESSTVAGSVSEIADTSVLSYEFTDLTAGETYSCYVVAASGIRESDPESAAFTTHPFTPEVDVIYFGTYNFSANWSVQEKGSKFDSFRVNLSGCTENQFSKSFAASVLSFVWDDLIPGSECRVDVRTISNDQYSDTASVSQNLYPATPEPAQTGRTINSASIFWELEGFATEIRLEIEGLRNETFTTEREATLVELEPFNIYSVTMDAYNGNLKNWVSAKFNLSTAPAPVMSASVQSISDTALYVTWDSVVSSTNQKVTYLITRIPLENVTETTNVNRHEVSSTEYMDKSLSPGTDYTYEISSKYSEGESDGIQTSGYTYPATPSQVLAEHTLNDATGLRWITTPNYDSFLVNVRAMNDSYEKTISTSEDRVYLEKLDPGEKYVAQIQSKYKDLVSNTSARLVFQTACYPIGEDWSKPWIVAFWITFIYAVIITATCLFLGYLVYNGSFPAAPTTLPEEKEAVKPQSRYLISASPLDGTKWQKIYPPVFLDNPVYAS